MIQNVVTLQTHTSAYVDTEKEKKLVFLTRRLELLSQNQFSMNNYCFALQSYIKCNYEQLRDFLVLPCKLKLQYIISYIDKDQLERVKEAAAAVERASGRVIGSITDNHKVNQQYCKLFERLGDCSATAKELPPLSQHFINRMLFVGPAVSQVLVASWIPSPEPGGNNKAVVSKHKEATQVLTEMHIWKEVTDRRGNPAYILNATFADNLKVAMLGG
ncbi:Transcription factor TFIIH subunit p52/Tfb2 [Trinorchestia longiramus]|nr:Transcription factor TFIIH subunit p52/Tfb2 [Trinorchestia longiramus]